MPAAPSEKNADKVLGLFLRRISICCQEVTCKSYALLFFNYSQDNLGPCLLSDFFNDSPFLEVCNLPAALSVLAYFYSFLNLP